MNKPDEIKTKRLVLRPLTPSDATDLFAVYSHPDAMRFWNTPPHKDTAVTQDMIANLLTGTACWWAICLPENGRSIGTVGYLGNLSIPGMGYILHPDYWRQGFTSEAVAAALDYGFQKLQLGRVELWINDDNIASQRLAQSMGFMRRGKFRHKYSHHTAAHDKIVYGLYAHEWQKTDAPAQIQLYQFQPVLAVSDVQQTAVYYRDKLHFNIDLLLGNPATFGIVSFAQWTTEGVHIQLAQTDQPLSTPIPVTLYMYVGANIDQLYANYQANNVHITRTIETHPWGMREFDVKDCNGFLLRFGTQV